MPDIQPTTTDTIKNVLRKGTYYELLRFFNLQPSSADSLVENITTLWNEDHSISSLSSKLGISYYLTKKIIDILFPDYHPETDYQHNLNLSYRTKIKLLSYFGLDNAESNMLYNKIYWLWHKEGTVRSLSKKLDIPEHLARAIINHIRANNIVRPFHYPNPKASQILEVSSLYKSCGTLEAVGKELGLTRERVRQILNEGKKLNLISYRPTITEQAMDLARKVNKEELHKLIADKCSENEVFKLLKNKYGKEVTEEVLNELLTIYGIDIRSLILSAKKNKCLLEYSTIVQEIGHHPTATEMAKQENWRKLWHEIDRLWGSMNNFRKDLGIPLVKKGNPRIEETWRIRASRIAERNKENKRTLLGFINANGPVTRKDIAQGLAHLERSLGQLLDELRRENLVSWSLEGPRIIYSKKVFSLENP